MISFSRVPPSLNRFVISIASPALLMLSACSSAPPSVRVSQQPQTPVAEAPSGPVTPQDYLKLAEDIATQPDAVTERNGYLLGAARAFQLQQDCPSAERVVRIVTPELQTQAQRSEAQVLLAECQIASAQADPQTWLTRLETIQATSELAPRLADLRSTLFAQQSRWLDAARATLEGSLETKQKYQQIWQSLMQLDVSSLERARLSETKLQPWLQLALMTHRYALEPQQLNRAVRDWQNRFAGTSIAEHMPEQVVRALEIEPFTGRSVAVLLPLSGRLEAQGQAIKDGMMAAFFNQLDGSTLPSSDVPAAYPDLRFFDTTSTSMAELANQLEPYDLIIGPLLKDNIEQLQTYLPANKPLLALNRITASAAAALDTQQYYFGLLPEDEAVQLAHYVREQGARFPVVISHDSATPERMAQAFLSTWSQTASEQDPAPGYTRFTDNKSMRNRVTEVLDVAQSKNRIDQIEGLVSVELHAVPRNRRDIDAIIVFADADQTELLNPIIESSLSPFDDTPVPVYASSRSVTRQLSKNSLRDLRNLTFTEMPWMLPEHAWAGLSDTIQQLWPERNDTLQRLFAMGYDSYQLLPHLRQLRNLPGISVQGLTGELSVAADGQVIRRLPYAQINNDKIVRLAAR